MEKANRRFVFFLAFFIVFSGVVALALWPFISSLQSPEYREAFSAWITGLGFRGVLILFCIMVFQVIVAPIPGGPVQIFAGAAYGTWGGLLITLAGCIVATMLIFAVVRRFGLPFVKRFLGDDTLDTWSFLASEKKASLLVFILFLIPGTPKSFLVYLGPLTRLSLVQFTAVSVFGRFPALLSSTIMGDAAMQGNWVLFFVVFGLTAVFGVLGIHFKERIKRRFSN
ncbi:MAG: VTT domain-containing protein [Treponema sp.]|nr:VTT domain-containing protein [Treponema sp.]